MSLLFMLSHTHMQSSEACFLWILLVVRLPRFSHIANFRPSADGERKTELQRYAGALAHCALVGGGSEGP